MNSKRAYNTKQKEMILNIIENMGDVHFTASDLACKLSESGLSCGTATVYRMIDRLTDTGVLRKYVVDGTTAACYQFTGHQHRRSCREHFHLKCENCGVLIHVECEELAKIAVHMQKDHDFLIDSSKTVFYGLCKDCKANR